MVLILSSCRRQIYWAKDIIFLITEHEFLGVQVSLCGHLMLNQQTIIIFRGVNSHSFFADPDPAVFLNTDPDPA